MKRPKRVICFILLVCVFLGSRGQSVFALETADLLAQAEVFNSSNGDGYTPYNLQLDLVKGELSYEVQQNSIWEEVNGETVYNEYQGYIYCNGTEFASTGTGGHVDYLLVKTDLFETFPKEMFERHGEYVFIVYAYNYEEDKVLGEVAKSEPYIVGGANATPTPEIPAVLPLELEADLRSETQAIFTINNADFSSADNSVGAQYTRSWVLSFDEYRFVVTSSLSPGASPNKSNTNIAGSISFICDFDLKDNSIIIELQGTTHYGGTEQYNLPSGFDLRDITEITVEYQEADPDAGYPDIETFSYPASDVADNRNWGQTYSILRTWPLRRFIQGTMRQEQYETLFFTPSTNNYIIAEATIDSADFYSRSASVPNAQSSGGVFTTGVTLLAWFDDNDRLLGIIERFNVPSSESGHNMTEAFRRINNEHYFYDGTTAYFKDDSSDYGWYYRPLIDNRSNYGPENQSTQMRSLEKNIIYANDFSAFVEGAIYKADYIAALESGRHDLFVPFTIAENND